MNSQQALELRDIYLPEAISWWPLAWGWWLLILLMLGLLALLTGWLWQRHRRLRPIRAALAEIQRIEAAHQGQAIQLAQEISILLRRLAMSLYGRREVAGLQGQHWLQFLEYTGAQFSPELKQQFLSAPYQSRSSQTTIDTQQWLALATQWIKAQKLVSVDEQRAIQTEGVSTHV